MIKTIRHTGIVVRNLQNSANFYRALGFEDVSNAIEEGGFIDQVTGLSNVKLEWIKLKSPDGCLLELLKYHSHPKTQLITMQESNKLGCSHVAFGVENIEKFCKVIKKNGGSIVNFPALTSDKKVKVAYCHDLEGVLIEVVEVI
jgi:catechol 2,3-dioxygenase-like lactoylglutathione lyase family enzyme